MQLIPWDGNRNATTANSLDLVEEWLADLRANERAETTITAYRRSLDVFLAWLQTEGIAPGMVTAPVVSNFKLSLGRYSAQTVNLRLSAIRQFYDWAIAKGLMLVDPAARIHGRKRPKSKTHKREALSKREVRSVLETCDTSTVKGRRDRAILSLMAYCGLRQVEVSRLDVDDLATRDDRLVLWVWGKGRDKDDKELVVIPHSEEQVIAAWVSDRLTFRRTGPLFVSLAPRNKGERLSTWAIQQMTKARYQEAGVVGRKTTHSLRHSAITSAIKNGGRPCRCGPWPDTRALTPLWATSMRQVAWTTPLRIWSPMSEFARLGVFR